MKWYLSKKHGEGVYIDVAVGMIATICLGALVTFGFYHITNEKVLPSIRAGYSKEPEVEVQAAEFHQRTDSSPVIDFGDTNTEANITAFYFQNTKQYSEINQQNHTVTVTVSPDTNITSMIPYFTLSDKATVSVAGIQQTSGSSIQDFSSSRIYTVAAESGDKEAWIVSVKKG